MSAAPRAAAADDPVARALERAKRWPRQLKFHREGVWLVLMIFGMGIAAINTGHNLIYLILGFLLSVILVSGILSEKVLGSTTVRYDDAEGIFAGEVARVPIRVGNERERGRNFSVRAAPLLHPAVAEAVPAYAAQIGPQGEARRILRVRFHRRGLHAVSHSRVQTDFPFSLVTKSRILPTPVAFRVWPRIHPVTVAPPSSARQDHTEHAPQLSPIGEDFFGVREYRPGDPPHRIHWKISARVGQTMVREFELPRAPALMLHCRIPHLDDALAEDRYAETAASLAVAALDAGYAVGLDTGRVMLPPDRGAGQRRRILDLLAEEPATASRAAGGVAVVAVDATGRPLPSDIQADFAPAPPRPRARGGRG